MIETKICYINMDTVKQRILEKAKQGEFDDEWIQREFDATLKEAIHALNELLAEGAIEQTYTPRPGTSYVRSYRLL